MQRAPVPALYGPGVRQPTATRCAGAFCQLAEESESSKANQRTRGDNRGAADVPRAVSNAPLHRAGHGLFRVEAHAAQSAA